MGMAEGQNRSRMRASGQQFIEAILDLMIGKASRTDMHSCVTAAVAGVILAEISTGGKAITRTSVDKVNVLRNRHSSSELLVVMTSMVTRTPWTVARRLPRTRTGMTWPMPGLETIATWSFALSMDSVKTYSVLLNI